MKTYGYGTAEDMMAGKVECETFEEAFDDALSELTPDVGETVYVCEVHPFKPRISADSLIENMSEDAWDRVGECAEDWPNHSKEEMQTLQQKIEKVVSDWLVEIKEVPDRFWVGGPSESFVVTEEHAKEYSLTPTSGGQS